MAQTEEGAMYERLMPRLFVTDRYPSKQRNCNSSLKCLLLVRDVLEGTDEMEQLLGSCFGHLFRLPVRGCDFSAKVVHEMLAMQVVTKKRFELWHVFGGHPMSVYMYNDLSLYMCTMEVVGEFDCEIHDRKVGYMVEILKAWHKFQNVSGEAVIQLRRSVRMN
ncbi:hypothetical protein Bca52824_089866 [Brassica carinata]|uniref:DUF1985 domain-containing protein n=1 Tax=Brassica carinata TaxID=52824 RepID=A0A8X7NTM6_BRACI|nr:hypothetical protein Bca52824_089866 [Brassica carinata]